MNSKHNFQVGDRVCWHGDKSVGGTVKQTQDRPLVITVSWDDNPAPVAYRLSASYLEILTNGLDRVLDEIQD